MIDGPEAASNGKLVRNRSDVLIGDHGWSLECDVRTRSREIFSGWIGIFAVRGVGVHDQIVVLEQTGFSIQDVGDVRVTRQARSRIWRVVTRAALGSEHRSRTDNGAKEED